MLLICPLLRFHVNHKNTKAVIIYLIVLTITSGCFSISISAVNIYIIFNQKFLANCSDTLSVVSHQLGIVNLRGINYNRILRLVLPDIVILIVSIVLLVLFSKLNSSKPPKVISSNLNENNELKSEEVIPLQTFPYFTDPDDKLSNIKNKDYKRRASREMFQSNNYMRKTIGIDELHNKKLKHWVKQSLFVFFNIVVTGFAGIISPSLLNSIYLLSYLGIGTFWACGKFVITQNFARMRICLLLYSALHVCLIYLVQIEFMQNYLPNGHFKSRLLGLYYLFDTSCHKRGQFMFNKERWIDFFSPFVIMYVYYLSATETRRWLEDRQQIIEENPVVDKDTINKTESLLSEDEINQDGSQILYKVETLSRQSSVDGGPVVDFADIPKISNSENSRFTLKVEQDVTKHEVTKKGQRPLVLSIINTLICNSFIFTFIAMMAWSVAYKSWMSFIFLLSACFLWIIPNSRTCCLYASPGIVTYAIVLIIIQYIYGFNLPELPTKLSNVSEMEFSEIGLKRWEIPTGTLAVMMGFLVMFWLTLRLFMTNKRTKDQITFLEGPNNDVISTGQSYESDHIAYQKFVKLLNEICEQYWIFMCCFAMLFVSIYGSVVIFRIVYMISLFYFLLIFMLSYSFWRKQMNVFWWVVIGYSVMVLLCIYVFQVKRISITVQNITGFSEETLRDIGLTRYEASNLLQGLLTPVIFLVILIVQVRYFQKKFMKRSSFKKYKIEILSEEKNMSKTESDKIFPIKNFDFIKDVNDDVQSLLQKLKLFYKSQKPVIWRFFECHFVKLVSFIIIYVCIIEVNALNIVLIILVVIGFPFQSLHSMMVTGSFIWCSLQIILKMIYQIKMFQNFNWLTNCSNFDYFPYSSKDKIDNAKWIGLVKVDNFQSYILKLAVIIVLCSIWHIIKYRQQQYYKFNECVYPDQGIIFPDITIQSSIESIPNFFKYSLNFSFYKIGLELSFVSTVIVSCLRIDVYSLIYLILLFILFSVNRNTCKKLWLPYMIFLGVLLPIQYAICIGLPPGLCIEYPLKMLSNKLRKWLYLPSYKTSPVSGKIMADLLQFVFVALQYQVFRIEKHKKYHSYKYELFENLQKTIHKDFISVKSSYIDYLKHAIFYWSYWLTLAIIFITGVFWITLFGLGYLIISFIYLWLGQIVLIGKRRNIIRSCNVFLYYNFLVILMKCTFQLMGCVYMTRLTDNGLCWMVSLFGIQCINPMSWEVHDILVKDKNKDCFKVESGLHWDVICFFFIIIQRKIFKADPFFLVRLDVHVQNKFSSRGAFYINQEMMKFIEEQKKKEKEELEKIEKKIDEISKRQAQHGKPELNEHYLVLRSGDYYLFDGDLEEEDKEDETNEDNDESLPLPFMSDGEESKSLQISRNICYSQSSSNSHSFVQEINENLISSNNFQDIPENNESENLDDDFSLPQYSLNPVQLITRLVKEGPRSALRQYKRSISESRDKILSRRSSVVDRKNSETCEKCANQNVCNSGSIRQDSFQSLTKCDNSIIHCQYQNLHTPIPSENETFHRSSDDSLNDSLEINVNDVADNIALESCWKKFKNGINLIFCFINSCMISLTTIFNRWTQEYSKIIRKIEKEKKLVKQVVLSKFIKIDDKLDQEIDEIVNKQSTSVSLIEDIDVTQKEYMFLHSKSSFFSLIISFGNIAIIYSEFICYFILILNHLLSGNLLSLPYPLLVFFWAMLSVPRPSKNFWIVIITYTEIVIVIKYIFQFNMIKFNVPSDPENRINPLSLPLIFGVEKTRTNAIIDVIQLLFLFLHRSYLKTNGIWRDHTEFYDGLYNINSENNGENCNKESSNPRNSHNTRRRIYNPIKQIQKFYLKMTNPKLNKRVDVYSVMFLCEFLSILIVIVGYVSFGPGTDSGVHAIDFIKSSKTPVPFIAMIITQFIFFIIDRALFLRKQVKGKFIFLIFHVLLIHAWLFFALPYITKRKFNSQFPPQLLYFVKCIYFALSAYQLKSGYPMRILGNFLTKKYNYANLIAFKIYMGIPFLYELRNVMDWMWTDSTIAFYHWMEVEDIFSKIFILKCWRYGEKIWPTERGQNRRLIVKYSVGIGLIFVFSLCIWGPLMISSFIGVTFVKYPPVECSFSINVGDYSPIFVFSSRENNMKQLSKDTFMEMKECYHRHSSSKDFLQSFEADDATEIIIDNASDNAWLITPPGLNKLKEKLHLNETLKINMQAICERETTDSKSTEKIVRFTQSRILSDEEKLKFLVAINTNLNQTDVHLPTIFPRFLTAFKRTLSETRPLHRNQNYTYLNISLSMKIHKSIMWWEISELIYGKTYCSNTTESSKTNSFLTIFIFNERISDNIFGQIFSNYGIIGIYAAYFFVVHRFLRTFYSNISYIIPYEELPNVDRIHKLLHEIYLVRENKKLLLEEQLIAKLIFLFRSSQTMIKWTQHNKSTLESVVEKIREMSQNNSINVMNESVDDHYVVSD